MSTRLTQLAVEKMKGGTARRETPDAGCPGLYLIVQKSGAKSWAIRSRIEGKPAKITIGAFPRLDLAAAREQALRMLADIDKGIDPRRQRAEEQRRKEEEQREEEERRKKTLRAVAENFRDKHMKRTQARSWKDRWAALDRHVLARLGANPIDQIRRRDLHEVLDGLIDKPGARHHVLSALSSLFRWAVDREIVGANPIAGVQRVKVGVRERALTDGELPLVWQTALAAGYPFGPFVRLLLTTGCRRTEIAGLRWSEVDLDQNTITIPAERYKTGRTLVVPLSQIARRLLDDLPHHVGGDHVFSTTGGRRPISGFSKMKRRFDAALAKRCAKDEVEPFDFNLHDLRRTVRTNMSALKVPRHVAEAVLGHVVTGVQKHYDRHSYLDEKREALDAWAERLERLVGENVVAMPARARQDP